ncbi:hypothetical protein LTR70_009985 [Exophiala xenobiotica]|uniref:Survival protein SurE-like phosphatase/nucleotidase domain-containing protein n=1 Tax=Lithohypha guttulata TaxID=1690604 RepID=A0ABR0JVM2_9EURO|nr:hypothetical protein LTR24_009900 [Lithohypha guttulata]KAK5309796.1 hypothetical protein LTR70_009985 [Exophiala xenobiotica]
MLVAFFFAALLPLGILAANVVLTNDDGWAEINVRMFYDALTNAGESVVLSSPAENKSGYGSQNHSATPLTSTCEWDSCPSGSPAQGFNSSNKRLNYVNSDPVTSMQYGIETLSPRFFGGAPVFAVAGVNVGANLGGTTLISGTVGAASYAATQGIPSIAFSGVTGTQTAWTALVQPYMTVYAALATNLTQELLASEKPYLPPNIWLNVNFPAVGSTCSRPDQFRFVLSRINAANGNATPLDVAVCGGTRLPTETDVVGTSSGCHASVSVGEASSKLDANASAQQVVLGKLKSVLRCLDNTTTNTQSSSPRSALAAPVPVPGVLAIFMPVLVCIIMLGSN